MTARLNLGARHSIDGRTPLGAFEMPTHHLLTHGVIVGMTGSGLLLLVSLAGTRAL